MRLPYFNFGFIEYGGLFPGLNYFVRAGWVIVIGLFISSFSLYNTRYKNIDEFMNSGSKQITKIGLGLLASLVLLHVIFH